jgi:hypothetical protein
MERLFDLMLPFLSYMVPWEFTVVAATPSPTPPLVTLDLVAVDLARCPVPILNAIPLWPGPSGAVAVPAIGTIALVRFADGNPTKPRVCGLDANAIPTLVEAYSSGLVQVGDATAQPVAHATWVANLQGDLVAFASSMGGATDPVVKAAAIALGAALALTVPSPTTKLVAT